jgi:transposase
VEHIGIDRGAQNARRARQRGACARCWRARNQDGRSRCGGAGACVGAQRRSAERAPAQRVFARTTRADREPRATGEVAQADLAQRQELAARATHQAQGSRRQRCVLRRGAKLALESPDGLQTAIDVLLQTFAHLTDQIAKLDEEITEIAKSDPVCARLTTMPGVGPIVSLAFVTHLDDVTRFASAGDLASYLALVPGEATTGGKTKRTRTITARGRCGDADPTTRL